MSGRLQNRCIAITGAASGIGKATAQLCVSHGAHVAFLDRDAQVQAIARAAGGTGIVCDVTDEASIQRAIEATGAALGGLDGMVNAAGIASIKTVTDTTRAHWDRVLAVNLTGPFLVCRAAQSLLTANAQSAIVNVASASALLPSGAGAAYAASKAGVLLLTKSLAIEWAPNVRVNAVCPGTVETPMIDGLFTRDAAFDARIQAAYALKRMASPEEIAHAIVFLLSNEASFVTGVSLAVDGGRSYH